MSDQKIKKIVDILIREYPDERLDLAYTNPFELLIASILAARSKDEIVNQCTFNLFRDFGTPEKLSRATPETLKPYISKINFWHRKAKIIIEVAKEIVERYGGRVPDDRESLMSLKGVGSKTANMVLAGAFSKPAIIVDTHFEKVSKRLGIVQENMSTSDIEEYMKSVVPLDKQTPFSLAMMRHGKKVCHAKNPECNICVLNELCEFRHKIKHKDKKDRT